MKLIFIRNSDLQGGNKIINLEDTLPNESSQSIKINKLFDFDFDKYDYGPIFIKYACKLYNTSIKSELQLIEDFNTIEIIPSAVGGYFDFFDDVASVVPKVIEEFIGPVIEPLLVIVGVIVKIIKIITFIIQAIVWLIQFFIWFIVDFCNPFNLAADFIGGIAKLTKLFFAAVSDAIAGVFKYFFNYLLTPIFSGFWGWDNVLDASQKEAILKAAKEEKNNPSGLVKSNCHGPGVKCFRTTDGHVPFTITLATILLPPMGVFMEFGLTSWINIIICGILTLAYYFPGLIYALVLIYS